MAWVEMKDRPFVNPYNFVPLPAPAITRKPLGDWRGAERGRVHCSLRLLTPLALPDHANETIDGSKHPTYPFLQLDNKPFIPGSELRGMIRSVFEAASNSCLSVLDESPLHAWNNIVNDDDIKAGLIKKVEGVWYLYPSKVYCLNTFNRVLDSSGTIHIMNDDRGRYIRVGNQSYYSGSNITFNAGNEYVTSRGTNTHMPFAENLGSGTLSGYLLLGELGLNEKRRHNSHIIGEPAADTEGKPLGDDECLAITNLRFLLKCYGDKDEKINRVLIKTPRKHSGYRGYKIADDGYTPVFYRVVENLGVQNLYYLSPSMISREVAYKRIRDMVGSYAPCDGNRERVCHGCGLFGTVGDKGAFGSALRFTDARIKPDLEPDFKRVTLKELSGPKISSVEFYTKRPEGMGVKTWTCDYIRTSAGQTLKPVRIRGRKFYLHHPCYQAINATAKNDRYGKPERTERNATVEMLLPEDKSKKEMVFEFDVYFDGIQESSMRLLLWCLSLSDASRPLCHKLGMGKPLGLGSVRITVDSVMRHASYAEAATKKAYHCESDVSDWEDNDARVPEELREILHFYAAGAVPVRYPMGYSATEEKAKENDNAGHQWFIANKEYRASGCDPRFNKMLPSISEIIQDESILHDYRKDFLADVPPEPLATRRKEAARVPPRGKPYMPPAEESVPDEDSTPLDSTPASDDALAMLFAHVNKGSNRSKKR